MRKFTPIYKVVQLVGGKLWSANIPMTEAHAVELAQYGTIGSCSDSDRIKEYKKGESTFPNVGSSLFACPTLKDAEQALYYYGQAHCIIVKGLGLNVRPLNIDSNDEVMGEGKRYILPNRDCFQTVLCDEFITTHLFKNKDFKGKPLIMSPNPKYSFVYKVVQCKLDKLWSCVPFFRNMAEAMQCPNNKEYVINHETLPNPNTSLFCVGSLMEARTLLYEWTKSDTKGRYKLLYGLGSNVRVFERPFSDKIMGTSFKYPLLTLITTILCDSFISLCEIKSPVFTK